MAGPLPLVIAGVTFKSRLFVGTGKFPSVRAMADAVLASGTELVTVAVRRVDLSGREDPTLASGSTRATSLPCSRPRHARRSSEWRSVVRA